MAACSSDTKTAATTTTPATTVSPATTTPTTEAASATTTTPATTPDTVAPTTEAPTTTAGTPGTVPTGPTGDAFYTPPSPIPGTKSGDLIWATPLASAPAGSSGWQVLYRSENLQGQPIAVSGVVIAPAGAQPGNPVLTWAHGTTGLGDQCTPSKQFVTGDSGELLLAGQALAEGWTYLETDYEGLGTPGVHPYLVGLSEARGVLDIVRAAQQLPGSGASAASKVMILGHSQGGGAALFAAEQAATYAPDLDVIGTAAGAPAGDLDAIAAGTWNPTTAAAFGAEMIAGFHAAYPDLPMDAVVNAAGAQVIDTVGTQCLSDTAATPLDPATVGSQNPLDNAEWATAIHDNTAGDVKPSAPVMIFHGEADTTVPRALTDLTLAAYCKVDATVEVKSYPGATHVSVILAALGDIKAFFAARLAGEPAATSC